MALLAGARGSATHAAQLAVRMQVNAGFGGYYRPDSFLPLHVRLSNSGSEIVATLQVDDAAQQFSSVTPYNHVSYTRTVVLPDGGVKDVTMYVPGADLGPSVDVALLVQGRIVAQQTVGVSQVSTATELIGVLSRTPAAYVQLKSFGGSLGGIQLRAVPLNSESLEPQVFALASLDAIVLENFDTTTLTSDQVSALDQWVRLGGVLITLGGPTAQAVSNGLPTSLRLAEPGTPAILARIPALASFSAATLPSSNIVAAFAGTADAVVLLDDRTPTVLGPGESGRGRPLLVQRSLGLGAVVYSAVDPTLAPLASWPGLQNLWTLLASPVRAGAATVTTTFAGSGVTNTSTSLNGEISSVAPPSMSLFIVLLGIYIFALLPANFVVLYRLKRRDLSWLTLPLLAVALVLCVFAGTYFGRGRDLRANLVSVQYQVPGSTGAIGQLYAGLISPSSGDYTVTAGNEAGLAAPLYYNEQNGVPSDIGNASSQVQIAEDSGNVVMPAMSSWSSRSVSFALAFPERYALSADLTLSPAGTIVGQIRNSGSSTVYGLLLQAFDGSVQIEGDVPPGASRAVSLPMGSGSQVQGDISSEYGNLGDLLRGPGAGAMGTGTELAEVLGPLRLLIAGASRLAAADQPIPLNPGESAAQRFQRISEAVLGGTNAAAFNSVIAVGWTAGQEVPLHVNGLVPQRSDTNLIVQPLPVQLHLGSLAVGSGVLPARIAGADQDLQVSAGEGGISLTPNSNAVFVAQLPPAPSLADRIRLSALTLSAASYGAGIALSDQTAALWDWQASRWRPVDISSGQVRVANPSRFFDGAGVLRVRMSAQTASLNISDPNDGVTIGVTGRVVK